jgi:hypothetical protein
LKAFTVSRATPDAESEDYIYVKLMQLNIQKMSSEVVQLEDALRISANKFKDIYPPRGSQEN